MGDFSKRFFSIVRRYLTKPHHEIWQELNGNSVLELELEEKTNQQLDSSLGFTFSVGLAPNKGYCEACVKIEKAIGSDSHPGAGYTPIPQGSTRGKSMGHRSADVGLPPKMRHAHRARFCATK